MLFFGVCDLPVFWGTDNLWNCTNENGSTEWLWWLEYYCKLPIYLGDLLCAVVLPLVSEKGRRRGPGDSGERGAQQRHQCVRKPFGPWPAHPVDGFQQEAVDVYWFATQIVSIVCSLHSIMHILPVSRNDPPVLPAVKMAVDAATDITTGGAWSMTGGLRRAAQPDEGRSSWHGQVGEPHLGAAHGLDQRPDLRSDRP